jgi:hypothetical protein
MTLEQADPQPGSMWLVVYECRYDVIRLSPKGDCFFAPGQEPGWGLDNISDWVSPIMPIEEEHNNDKL